MLSWTERFRNRLWGIVGACSASITEIVGLPMVEMGGMIHICQGVSNLESCDLRLRMAEI